MSGYEPKERAVKMSENNRVDSNASEQQQDSSQALKPASPDPDVQAPQNVLITEGYEPPAAETAD